MENKVDKTLIERLEFLRKSFGDDLKLLELIYEALNGVINSVVITNKEGNIVWVNQSFTDNTGCSFGEAVSNKPSILKSGKHDNEFYKNLWDTINSGNIWKGTIVNKYKDGNLVEERMIIMPVNGYFIAVKQICE